MPSQELSDTPAAATTSTSQSANTATSTCAPNNANANVETNVSQASSNNHDGLTAPVSVSAPIPLAAGSLINARPGSMVRVPETIANGSKCVHVNWEKKQFNSRKKYCNFRSVLFSLQRERCVFALSSTGRF